MERFLFNFFLAGAVVAIETANRAKQDKVTDLSVYAHRRAARDFLNAVS